MKRGRGGSNLSLPKSLLNIERDDDDKRDFSKKKTKSRKQLRKEKKNEKKKKNLMIAERNFRMSKKSKEEQQSRKKQKQGFQEDSDQDDSDIEHDDDDDDDVIEDNDVGVVVEDEKKSAYVAPHLRQKENSGNTELQRRLRSLLNKVAEGNLHLVTQQMADSIQSAPRSAVVDTIASLMIADTTTDSSVMVTQKLVAVYAAVASVLYHEHNFGPALPSTIAEKAVSKFEELYGEYEPDKKLCTNLVMFVGYMYHFMIVSSILIVDLCKRLLQSFGPLEVELLLKLMQLVGMKLRSECPGDLVDLIKSVDEAIGKAEQSDEFDHRAKFMLETLSNIKNNRFFEKDEYLMQLDKALKPATKGKKRSSHGARYLPVLRFSWKDLVDAQKTGKRWWLTVGGRPEHEEQQDLALKKQEKDVALPEELEALAKKLRMNTDLKVRAFAVIMTAEGYLDAFEKIQKMDLRGKTDREIVYVLCECCYCEREYNAYYGMLAVKLCESKKAYKVTFQYYLWDQLREIQRFTANGRRNMGLLIKDLVANGCLTLTVLKPVDFLSDLEAGLKETVNVFLSHLIGEFCCSDEDLFKIFKKASEMDPILRDGIALFLRFSLTFEKKTVQQESKARIKERLQISKKALTEKD